MLAAHPILADLSVADRDWLEAWLVEFDMSWEPGRLPARARELPPDGPLRLAALIEMAKIDMERHWHRGRPILVEDYLRDYPELATLDGPPTDLIETEWEARTSTGETPDPEAFCQRFPRQCESIRGFHRGSESSSTPLPSGSAGLTLAAAPVEAPGVPDRIGRYRIVRCLGEGGMGTVYLAHDDELDRPVALKVPHFAPGDGLEVRERFRQEARAAAALDHPNLCRVYDVGEWAGTPYLTMAFIEGRPLGELTAAGLLPPDRIADLLRKVAEALAYAHERGIVHRDLKPSNILLDGGGEPVVVDFGLARRERGGDPRLTRAGIPLGTPGYMSPEQVAGAHEVIGPATDVYSLGVILYELLAGQLPFRGPALEVMVRIATETPPPPSALRSDADSRLEVVCLRAMAKELKQRFASMGEMAAALGGGRPQSTRRRIVPVAAGAVALIGVGLALFFLLGGDRTAHEREHDSDGSEAQKQSPPAPPAPARKREIPKVLPEPTVFKGRDIAVTSVAFAADGNGVLSVGKDNIVRRWNPDTGKEEPGAGAGPNFILSDEVVFSPDGRRLVAGSLQAVELFDVGGTREILTTSEGGPHTGPKAFAANGRRVVIARMSVGGKVTAVVWDLEQNKTFSFTSHPELEALTAVALSANGTRGASASKDGVRVWEVESGKELRHWDRLQITTLSFTPDAGTVLTGDGLGNLVLRDPKSGAEVGRFEGHTGGITAATFSRDGGLLITGSQDGTARVWDVAKRKGLWKLDGPTGGVTCVALSADGRRVLSGGKDGSVRLWRLPPLGE